MKNKAKSLSVNQKQTGPSPKTSLIFRKIMKPNDWIAMVILLLVFIISWVLVWQAYSQPLGYENVLGQSLE